MTPFRHRLHWTSCCSRLLSVRDHCKGCTGALLGLSSQAEASASLMDTWSKTKLHCNLALDDAEDEQLHLSWDVSELSMELAACAMRCCIKRSFADQPNSQSPADGDWNMGTIIPHEIMSQSHLISFCSKLIMGRIRVCRVQKASQTHSGPSMVVSMP